MLLESSDESNSAFGLCGLWAASERCHVFLAFKLSNEASQNIGPLKVRKGTHELNIVLE